MHQRQQLPGQLDFTADKLDEWVELAQLSAIGLWRLRNIGNWRHTLLCNLWDSYSISGYPWYNGNAERGGNIFRHTKRNWVILLCRVKQRQLCRDPKQHGLHIFADQPSSDGEQCECDGREFHRHGDFSHV